MKLLFPKLFHWKFSKETKIPFFAGFLVTFLSLLMVPARPVVWLELLIRDVAMIFLVGLVYPVYFIQNSGIGFKEFGMTLKRCYIYLPVNVLLGYLLLQMFLSENQIPGDFSMNHDVILKIAYIMLAGIFEVIFFYSFLRTLFERSFGIVPGIILAALFYAFHHAGFQPEFGKLFFVGILYATVFRLGNSALLIYPFFWGVGACYDVLIQSQVVSAIEYPGIRTGYLSALIISWLLFLYKKRNAVESRIT